MLLLLVALALSQDDEIVVTGTRPRLTPGLWRFDRSTSRMMGHRPGRSGGRRSSPPRGYHWHYCVVSPDVAVALPYALAAVDEYRSSGPCTALRFRIVGSGIEVRSSCNIGRYASNRTVRGTATGERVSSRSVTSGLGSDIIVTHDIEGHRIGDCPPPPTVP